jgi:hypothetical protein
MHNAQHLQVKVHKTARMMATTISQYVTEPMKLRFLKENLAVGLPTRLWAGRYQGSNSGKGKCFLCLKNVQSASWAHSVSCLVYTVLLQRG